MEIESNIQSDTIEMLSRRIERIRKVVRRDLILPRTVRSIRELKRGEGKDDFEKSFQDDPQNRRIRLERAVEHIRNRKKRERIPMSVDAIKSALLRDFENDAREKFKLLLRAICGGGIPLASLTVCGRGTREIRYTQLLRYFLDPGEPHGLSTALIKAVVGPEILRKGYISRDVNWEKATVKAEYPLGHVRAGVKKIQCVIDLFIEIDEYLVLIENKINSQEAGVITSGEISQLRRYSRAIIDNFPEYPSKRVLKIFLTPDGRLPKEDAEWLPLSYKELLGRAVQGPSF